MDELRVILLLIGAAILAAVYFFSRPRKAGQARSQERRAARGEEPEADEQATAWRVERDGDPPTDTVTRELKRLGELISRDRGGEGKRRRPAAPRGREMSPDSEPAKRDTRSPSPAPGDRAADETPPPPDPDRIVVLYVRARGDQRITGPRLIEAARMAGLEYGDMDIYHRLDESGNRESIFSMANMVAPGTLEHTQSPDFSTPGVALFMRLPGPLGALDAWDAMLATARRLAELLDADMLDENHSSLNRQRIQQIREDMREYERRATLEIKRK